MDDKYKQRMLKASRLTAGRYKLLYPCNMYKQELPSKETSNLRINNLPNKPLTALLQPNQVVQTQGSVLRTHLIPPTNKEVEREIEIVKQYIKDVDITDQMQKFTSALLKNDVLPYNPYPSYIRRFHRLAEKFHMREISLSEIRRRLDVPVYNAGREVLFEIKFGNSEIWGLEYLVAHIDPNTIRSFKQMALSSTVSSETISQQFNQQISAIITLSGPCIFSNSFYHDWSQLDVNVEVLLASPDKFAAAKIFAHVLIEELRHIESHKSHHYIDLILPIQIKNAWTSRVYFHSELTQLLSSNMFLQGSAFLQQLSNAAISNKSIVINCLLHKSDASLPCYFPTVKTYSMLLVLKTTGPDSQYGRDLIQPATTQLIFSTLPYQTLYEGLFLDRLQADLYLSTFEEHFKLQNQESHKIPSRLHPLHPSLTGFIVTSWQKKIANSVLEHGDFCTIHYILLLHLSQTRTKSFSKHTEDDVAIQIARLGRATGARLRSALLFSPFLLLLLSDSRATSLIQKVASTYRYKLLDVVDRDMSMKLPEMKLLKELLVTFLLEESENLTNLNSGKLCQLYYLASTVYLNSFEDALECCPAVLAVKSQLDAIHPDHMWQPIDIENQSRHQHGLKTTSWIDVDYLRISKQSCIANSQAPKGIAAHFSLLQYCTDIRIDDIWKEFLEHVMVIQNYLPPNPYPFLLCLLRKANMSVQSIFESNSTVVNRLIQRKIVSVEDFSNVFNVTGCAAYGQEFSLLFIHPLGFRQATEIAMKLLLSPPGKSTVETPVLLGNFQLIICSGVTMPATFYGSINPLMWKLDIDEHCYIKGPQNGIHHGSTALAQMVFSHLKSLRSEGVVTYLVHFGDIRMNIGISEESASRFVSEFVSAVNGNQIIQLSLFHPIGWRYILVKKRLLIYYVQEATNFVTPMFPTNARTIPKIMAAFFHPRDAEYCYRSCKPQTTVNSFVASLWLSRDWPQLIEELVAQAQFILSEASDERKVFKNVKLTRQECYSIVAFSWRYCNGTPGQLDYVMSLTKAIEVVMGFVISSLEEFLEEASSFTVFLADMIIDYRIKLKEIVERPSTLSPSALSSLLRNKFETIISVDKTTKSLQIIYNQESLDALREIYEYLLVLRNLAVEDLVNGSPTINEYLNSL